MFEYRWLESTLDQLAAVYIALNPQDRDRMAAGVEALNTRLGVEPHEIGESRVGGYRIVFVPLLAVSFHVDVAARQVRVTNVTRYGR